MPHLLLGKKPVFDSSWDALLFIVFISQFFCLHNEISRLILSPKNPSLIGLLYGIRGWGLRGALIFVKQ